MYLDIDANDNLPEAAMATFNATGPGVAIRAVRLHLDGAWTWCAVTGWGPAGPCPAWWTPIEESGDGPAFLAHGGDHGLRLARIADPTSATVVWDLTDGRQWGEPFLICTPETEVLRVAAGAP